MGNKINKFLGSFFGLDAQGQRVQNVGAATTGTDALSRDSGDARYPQKASGSISILAVSMWPSTTGGATVPTKIETTTNKLNYWVVDFIDVTTTSAEFEVWMPDDWDGGTITARFLWETPATSTNAMLLGIAGRSFGDNELPDQALGTEVTASDAGDGTASEIRISPATGAVTIAGATAGELVHFKVTRTPSAGGDTLAATVRLRAVRLIYGRV